MGEDFVGEIRMVGFGFAPLGWALCDGTLLPISQENAMLFSLLGTTFGGDGVNTFALRDLRCRAPVGVGVGTGPSMTVARGEQGGSANVIISEQQMPYHTHILTAGGTEVQSAGAPSATNNVLGACGTGQGAATIWSTQMPDPIPLNPRHVRLAGGSQPLSIRNPYIGVNFIICLQGIYPSPTNRW
jgi:microcystin-dependent protein